MTKPIDMLTAHARRVGLQVTIETQPAIPGRQFEQLCLTARNLDDPLRGYLFVVATHGTYSNRWTHAAHHASSAASPLKRCTLRRAHSWIEIMKR